MQCHIEIYCLNITVECWDCSLRPGFQIHCLCKDKIWHLIVGHKEILHRNEFSLHWCNAYAGSGTLAYNSNLMSPGDIYIHYQKLPEPPTVTEVFWCVCRTILIHSEMGEHQTAHSEWDGRLPCHFVNTPHRLEMEDGGVALWRKGTQGEERGEINEWPQREERGGWQWWRDGDSHLCSELPAAAVGSRWRPSPARYSGGQCCFRPRYSASPGPPGRTGAEGSEVWAQETKC